MNPRVRVDCYSGPALQKPPRITLCPERSIPQGEGSVNPSESSWQALGSSHELEKMDVGRRRCRDKLQGSGSMCHGEVLAGEDLAAPSRYRRETRTGGERTL